MRAAYIMPAVVCCGRHFFARCSLKLHYLIGSNCVLNAYGNNNFTYRNPLI